MWFVEMIEEALGVRSAAARDILAYWLALILALATIGGIYWLLRHKTWAGPRCRARQHRGGEIRRRTTRAA
jgi:hypothetical protein